MAYIFFSNIELKIFGKVDLHIGCIRYIRRSIALATKPGVLPDLRLMILLGVISLLMHTSCCTLNDLHDIKFDRQVININ